VESDEVGAEQALEDLLALRKDPERLRRGEGDVEEESDSRLGNPGADQRRHAHELVVVDPDQVARAVMGDDRIGEPAVHSLVVLEPVDLQRQLAGEVVEQRPEHAVGVRLVVPLHLLTGERDLDQTHRLQTGSELGLVLLRERIHETRPADPEPTGTFVRPPEPGGHSADARLDLDSVRIRADRHRKPVGHDEDAGHSSALYR
jgi:hypothetical protein